MQAIGGTLVKHYRESGLYGLYSGYCLTYVLFSEIWIFAKKISNINKPDVVILIDYPGFNLKIAKYVRTTLNIPVHYYISPKIWAWKQYRIKSFRKYVNRMFCIFPFEPAFFASLNYKVDYVGNPTVDSVSEFKNGYTETFPEFSANSIGGSPVWLYGRKRK